MKIHCEQCNTLFNKAPSQIKKTKHNFCSKQCSGTFHNRHKTTGKKKSKFESWIQMTLEKEFPDLEVKYNQYKTINNELDMYIPSLKLAFEINGITHKRPIYGQEALDKVMLTDQIKKESCQEKGIELVTVDISDMPSIKNINLIKHTDFIVNKIKDKLNQV